MRALVTGAGGFVGSYVTTLLEQEGFEVFGIDKCFREGSTYKKYQIDINDMEQMEKVIRDICPDQIYHLAAPAFIPDSYTNPKGTFDTIVFGTINILEILRNASPYSKLLYVGSSDEYGVHVGTEPFVETMLPKPCTPYAAAKVSASVICDQYARFYDIDVVRTRSFNHCGPGQAPKFVCASMARQIALMEKSGDTEIHVGDLSTNRDFLDVRDVVRAYYTIMQQKDNAGELYNVCSGKHIPISHVLDTLLKNSTLDRNAVHIVRECQARRFDSRITIGDNAKLKALGWEPEHDIDRTLAETLQYWRQCV